VELHVHAVSGLSGSRSTGRDDKAGGTTGALEPLTCVLERKGKAQQTRVSMSDGQTCAWEETLVLPITLYAAKQKGNKANQVQTYDPKLYTLRVYGSNALSKRHTVGSGIGSSSGSSSSSKGLKGSSDSSNGGRVATDLRTEIDMAAYATNEHAGKETTLTLPIRSVNGKGNECGGGGALIKLTIKVSPAQEGSSSKGGSHRRQNSTSMSINGSPLHPAQHQSSPLTTFTKEAVEFLSPELASRPLPVKFDETSHMHAPPSHYRDPSSSQSQSQVAGGDEGAKGGPTEGESAHHRKRSMPESVAEANESYAIDEDEVEFEEKPAAIQASTAQTKEATAGVTPVSYSSGGSKEPEPTPSSSRPVPFHRVASTPLHDRRTETQIFSSIMVNELAMHSEEVRREEEGERSNRPSLSRARSMQTPMASRAASRRPSLQQARQLRVCTNTNAVQQSVGTPEAQSVPTIEEDREQGKKDGEQMYDDAYAHAAAGSTAPRNLPMSAPPPHSPPIGHGADEDDDDDLHGGLVPSASFADRHDELTVEDILNPSGLSAADAHAATKAAAARRRRHGRVPSLYDGSQDGQLALEQMLRPGSTAARSNRKKFFSGKKKESGGSKSSTLSGPIEESETISESPPASAPASSTPLTHPVPTTNLDPVRRRSIGGRDREMSASGASASRQSQLDEIITGSTAGTLHTVAAEHSSLSSQQSARTSRSSSPSRSLTVGAGSTSTLLSTSSHPSMHLPSPSPRNRPAFPMSTPAKHSAVYTCNRHSPFNSLSKSEAQSVSGGVAGLDASADASNSPPEAGSLAAYRQAVRDRTRNRSQGGSQGNIAYGAFPVLDASRSSASYMERMATRSMPRKVAGIVTHCVQTTTCGASGSDAVESSPHTAPDHSGDAPSSVTSRRSRAVTIGGGTADLTASEAASTMAEFMHLEREFRDQLQPSVQLLCEQLTVPDVVCGDVVSPLGSDGDDPDKQQQHQRDDSVRHSLSATVISNSNSNSITQASSIGRKRAPFKALWNTFSSIQKPSTHNGNVTLSSVFGALKNSTNLSSATPTPPPFTPFYKHIPVWSCVTVRCLSAWDAFSVWSFASERVAEDVHRVSARSWILSQLLTHMHQTSIYVCARSAAGQRQQALAALIANIATLMQLCEGYSKSPQAPPDPVVHTSRTPPDAATIGPASPSPISYAQYEHELLTPCFPSAYATHDGLSATPSLPSNMAHRISELARTRLRTGTHRGGSFSLSRQDNPLSHSSASDHYPFRYELSLGVSLYDWFLSHLRQHLHFCYQCTLELAMTEVTAIAPETVLSPANDHSTNGDQVGYEETVDQMLTALTKIWEDMVAQCVAVPLRLHFIRCIMRHLSSTLFNAVMSSASLMNMTGGMRLKIITTSIHNWARLQQTEPHAHKRGHSSGGSMSGIKLTDPDSSPDIDPTLAHICTQELSSLDQLAMLLLMDKQTLSIEDLAALCPDLSPVSLYHLLLHYRAPESSKPGKKKKSKSPSKSPSKSALTSPSPPVDEQETVSDSLLEDLIAYQNQFMPHADTSAAQQQQPGATAKRGPFPVLFRKWSVHAHAQQEEENNKSKSLDQGVENGGGVAASSNASKSTASIHSPFMDAFDRMALPSLLPSVSATAPARSSVMLLPLAAAPLPPALLQDRAFAFLQTKDEGKEGTELVLPVESGAE